MGKGKKILIWSGVITGIVLIGVLIYAATKGKGDKLEAAEKLDKEMADLMKRIDKAKK